MADRLAIALAAVAVPGAVIVVGSLSILALLVVVLAQFRTRRRIVERLGRLAARTDRDRDGDGHGVAASVDADDAVARLERSVDRLLVRERSAAEALVRLDRALGAIPEGVVVTDANGVVVVRNAVAEHFADARHGDALVEAALDELVSEVLVSGREASRTLDLFGPPRRAVVIDAVPLAGAGRSVGALAIVSDVTERRRLEAVRRDFVANISHELKTPVGALSLLAETMIGEPDADVARRLAERMMNEAMRVAATIEDLIQLSRIEADEAPVREPVPVAEIVAAAVTRLRPAAEQAGIVVDVGDVDERLRVLGDRRQLVSAVSNLIDNAVKYSDAGSVIEVRSGTESQTAWISVSDHGIGIPARDLERVFERFYRVDVARSRQTGGTGLGLAIVRHVVNNHEGEVEVRSRMGEGSTFVLQFPVLSGAPAVSELAPTSEPAVSEPLAASEPLAGSEPGDRSRAD